MYSFFFFFFFERNAQLKILLYKTQALHNYISANSSNSKKKKKYNQYDDMLDSSSQLPKAVKRNCHVAYMQKEKLHAAGLFFKL